MDSSDPVKLLQCRSYQHARNSFGPVLVLLGNREAPEVQARWKA